MSLQAILSLVLLVLQLNLAPVGTGERLPQATGAPAPPFPWVDGALQQRALRPAFWPDLSLLDRPTRYQLLVDFDPRRRSLSGRQWIRYTNHTGQQLSDICLRLFANRSGHIQVIEMLADGIVRPYRLRAQDSALCFTLPHALTPNAETELYLAWALDLPRPGAGNYGELAFGDDVLAMASFYPTIPMYTARGWDLRIPPPEGDLTYLETSLYLVRFTAPAVYQVASTGVTLSSAVQDGRRSWTIASGPARDFNLVAGEHYGMVSGNAGGVQVHSFYRPGDEAGGQQALTWATEALGLFGQLFGSYPYTELDVLATPTTAGGIEYPGLVVINQDLYDQGEFDFFQDAVVHEVAHQWWYALVGNDQVGAPWLDEAMAQYSTARYVEPRYRAGAFDQVLDNFHRRWQAAELATIPIGLSVAAYHDPVRYSAIVYGRGPLFLQALRQRLGDERFSLFLHAYFLSYRYGLASPAGFLTLAETVSHQDLADLWRTWVIPGAATTP